MSLKIFKSYTKSTRGTVLVDRKNVWKGKPVKSLTVGSHSTGGRNNLGRITSRHKGAGHKQKYRQIDFYRKKDDMKAKIERIEYDPNRSAHVALIKYEDGTMNYIISPNNVKIGDEIISGRNKKISGTKFFPKMDRTETVLVNTPVLTSVSTTATLRVSVTIFEEFKTSTCTILPVVCFDVVSVFASSSVIVTNNSAEALELL